MDWRLAHVRYLILIETAISLRAPLLQRRILSLHCRPLFDGVARVNGLSLLLSGRTVQCGNKTYPSKYSKNHARRLAYCEYDQPAQADEGNIVITISIWTLQSQWASCNWRRVAVRSGASRLTSLAKPPHSDLGPGELLGTACSIGESSMRRMLIRNPLS